MRLDVRESGGGFGGNSLPAEDRFEERAGAMSGGTRGGDVIVVLLCLAVLAGMGFILWKVSPDGFGLFKQPEAFGVAEPAVRITPSVQKVLDRVAVEQAKARATATERVTRVAAVEEKPVVVMRKSAVVVKRSRSASGNGRGEGTKGREVMAAATGARAGQTMAPAKAALVGVRPMVSKSGAVVITPVGNGITQRAAKGARAVMKGA